MEEIVVVDTDDMVHYIYASLVEKGVVVNDEIIRAVLDAETDYLVEASIIEEEI